MGILDAIVLYVLITFVQCSLYTIFHVIFIFENYSESQQGIIIPSTFSDIITNINSQEVIHI